jgi:hypothetical protein
MQELQKLQQENLILKTKHDTEAKRLEIEEYQAETQRLVAYADILKTGDEMEIKRLEAEARQQLEAEESEHDRNMDVANLLQTHALTNQQQENSAAEAESNREFQASQADADRKAQAKAKASSTQKSSTPSSD